MVEESWLKGAWLQTYTGKQFWPLAPRVEDIDIRDIAHALSLQCRFAGHCKRYYSVAEHSILLADHVLAADRLWALLHDATEAYLVDVPRPIKPHLTNYKQFEATLMAAICERFGLPPEMPAGVHEADNRILFDERNQNLTPPPMPWNFELEPLGVELKFWAPEMAEEAFLQTFQELTGETV